MRNNPSDPRPLIAFRAVVYMTAFIWLWGWIALRVRVYDRDLGIALPAWTAVAGPVLMAAGGLLVLACAAAFVTRGRGTPALFDPPRAFVASGPYRYVRNPMYLGGLTLLAGFGLLERSPSILLLALALFALVHLFVVFVEEPGLARRFGPSYLEYRGSVNRWMPRDPR